MNTVTRLITFFKPSHYNLSLSLEREKRSFSGTVSIEGHVLSSTVLLHAKDLTIETVQVNHFDAEFSLENDELSISCPQHPIEQGEAHIDIVFHGTITNSMHGLYPCFYEQEGEKKELLATQFESHHAREVFPCIDEPEAKATFDLTLLSETGVEVLSNMPLKEQREVDGKLSSAFETTPRMSTYLLAWVVGDLQKVSATTKSGVEVNVWATKVHPQESLRFALEVATNSIDFYNTYFDTPYPLPKSDHIALPDFSSGAMENWGLITYREMALLADPQTTSITSRQYIATVIAHELAHQWFGNLVTMKWWNDLWLNESFATLMEYITIDHLYPSWNVWLDFASNESIVALRRDSLAGVQTVQEDVSHPDEISTLFDGAIVYAKGARLLRMLQYFIGEDAFQRGLKEYFKTHAYQNTEAVDLWSALHTASGVDVDELMTPWLTQSGYPVVSVREDEKVLHLSQQQFLLGETQASQTIWPIPLNATDSTLPKLMTDRAVEYNRTSSEPVRFNVGDTAHFITFYDTATYAAILEQVRSDQLSVIDRVQLLNEATLLCRGGLMSSAQLIDVVDAFSHEESEPVWSLIAITLIELRKFVEEDDTAEKQLRLLSRRVAAEQYRHLGWYKQPQESEEQSKLRSIILSLSVYGEDPDALQEAETIFTTTPLNGIDPDIRSLVLSCAVRYGEDERVDQLLEAYRTTTAADLKGDLGISITSTRSTDKIKELLALTKDGETVRPQDVARWISYLMSSKYGRELTWAWIRDNWNWIIDTFSGDMNYDDYPVIAAARLMTDHQLQEFIDFFTPLKTMPALTRVIEIGIGEIEARLALLKRDGEAVRTRLLTI